MSVKCPSCGFDSPNGALWCDFCKEPFRAKAAPAAAAPRAVPAAASAPKTSLKDLEMQPDPEQLPTIPKWARLGAWIFLGIWIILGCIMAGVMSAKYTAR